MIPASTAWRAARAFSLPTLFHYARYQLKLRSGWLRMRTALEEWPDLDLSPGKQAEPVGLGVPSGLAEVGDWGQQARAQAVEAGGAVLAGRFPAFGGLELELGFPPKWGAFLPIAGGEQASPPPQERHWTAYQIDGFEADVKLLWELSRFAWVYPLARAFRWSGQARFAEGFWALLSSWAEGNPPNRGPQWISAQEVAFRALALGFARGAFWPWLVQEPSKLARLTSLLRAHAGRIPPTLDYSRAQDNNHRLSEAVGLLMAGVSCPAVPQAGRWRRLGRAELIAGLRDQIFDDGGYVQHSHNYARLALELGLVGIKLAERAGRPLPPESGEALRRLSRLLARMVEPGGGQPPNFGHNDGSQLLPLTSCGFRDFRPALQAAAAVLGGSPVFRPGPWDELCLWLGETPPEEAGSPMTTSSFPQAGLYRLDGQETALTLRAANFSSRPGHSDQLQLDLWWRGSNLALDPGTYLYGGRGPWDNGLAGVEVHNAVSVDDQDPMRRAGRFLWLDWSKATIREKISTEGERLALLRAMHDGYRELGFRQERTVVRVDDDYVLVIDDLLGEGWHRYLLPWLAPDCKWEPIEGGLRLQLPIGQVQLAVVAEAAEGALYRAGERLLGPSMLSEPERRGWYSPCYGLKVPALHWITAGEGELPLQIRTRWSLGEANHAEPVLQWRERPGSVPHLAAVTYDGDRLER